MGALQTLGIAGGIGSGKSIVSRLLRIRGVPVYDTDREAKRLMSEDRRIRSGLIDLFGSDVYLGSLGELNKPFLASRIFADPGSYFRVNALVHPVVKLDFCAWRSRLASRDCRLCAIESALLYEAGLDALCSAVVAVVADDDIRIERAMKRDKANREAIQTRMAKQLSTDELTHRADFVLYNHSPCLVIPQLDEIIKAIAPMDRRS